MAQDARGHRPGQRANRCVAGQPARIRDRHGDHITVVNRPVVTATIMAAQPAQDIQSPECRFNPRKWCLNPARCACSCAKRTIR
jgi:hypothetical protein